MDECWGVNVPFIHGCWSLWYGHSINNKYHLAIQSVLVVMDINRVLRAPEGKCKRLPLYYRPMYRVSVYIYTNFFPVQQPVRPAVHSVFIALTWPTSLHLVICVVFPQ